LKKVVLIVALLVLACISSLVLVGNLMRSGSDKSMPYQEGEQPFSKRQVTIYCPECGEMDSQIDLWAKPDGKERAGSLPNQTPATVLDSLNFDGVLHFQVQAGDLSGWIAEFFSK
jgi:hypothetical protein